jgi:AI-2 transport protein TqsA
MVNAGVTVVNILAENVLSPVMMSRGLSISPTVVYRAWLLGGPGAFLALPMTLFVAVMLDTFPETRWPAKVVVASSSEKSEPSP